MKNKLERFVNTHRDSFDSELPPNSTWDSIDTAPKQKGKLRAFFTGTRIAASLLVLINATVIIILLQKKPEPVATATPMSSATEQVEGNKEPTTEQTLGEIEKSIVVKQAALKEIEKSNPFLYKKFTAALSQLNSAYKDLQKELGDSANKEELLEAMIQNLGLQQDLLNQQLSIYQKVKQQKSEKNNIHI